MTDRNYFPAMLEQIGFLEFFKILPKCGHNICARMDFDSEIDVPLMIEAMETGFARLPYCCMRLHRDGKQLLGYFSEEKPQIEALSDLRGLNEEEVDRRMEKWCHAGLGNDSLDTQLYAVYPALVGDGRFSLVFVSSHLLFDGYSQMYALQYVLKVYVAMKNGTELPPPGIDPVPYMKKDTELLLSPKRAQDAAWWEEQLQQEPHFTSVNGKESREFIRNKAYGKALTPGQIMGENRIYAEKIPPHIVHGVEEASAKSGISPQSYYLFALRTYLSQCSGTDDVTVSATVSRRATLESKHCGLMMANILPLRSIVSDDERCSDVLRRLFQTQLAVYRHTTTDQNQLRQILGKIHGLSPLHTYETVWLTYQPYYNYSDVDLHFSARPLHSGIASIPLYIYLMPRDDGGDLWAECYYCVDYVKEESIRSLLHFMTGFLEAVLKDPDRTVAEIKALL